MLSNAALIVYYSQWYIDCIIWSILHSPLIISALSIHGYSLPILSIQIYVCVTCFFNLSCCCPDFEPLLRCGTWDVSVSWPVNHDGPDWNISTIGWTAMKLCTVIDSPQRMNPTDFGDPLTYTLVPPWGSHFWFLIKCLNIATDCHDIWHAMTFMVLWGWIEIT